MVWQRSRHKYNAKKVKIDGITFDSKAEARRYGELKLLQKAGKIGEITVHPTFNIEYGEVKICRVVLDFSYELVFSVIYEDVKGIDTPISRLKRKLLLAFYGIKVEVIK